LREARPNKESEDQRQAWQVEVKDGGKEERMRVKKSFRLMDGLGWVIVLGFGVAQAQSQIVTVAGNNRAVILDGQGRDFMVAGNHDDVRINGDCKSVRVMGNQNTIHLERVDEISVTGAQNKLFYQSGLTRSAPSVSQTGAQNRVAKSEGQGLSTQERQGQPASGDESGVGQLVFTGDDLNLTRSANAQRVRLQGDRNHLTLTGSVDELLVTGKNNSVAVDKVGKVRFLGDNNSVTYRSAQDGQKPEVTSLGENNSIRQAGQ
jgi:Protein of unknown function (DUF3060)